MYTGAPRKSGAMKVAKVGVGSRTELVWLSEQVLWVRQHWMRRAHLCTTDDDCPGCRWNSPRGIGFVAVRTSYGQVCLIEVSPLAFDRFSGVLGMDNGFRLQELPGQRFTASRRGSRTPVVLEPLGERLQVTPTKIWDVLACVAILYGLPGPSPGESVETFRERVKPAMESQLSAAVSVEQTLVTSGRRSRGS